MNIQKTYWSNSENSMALHFPITKVNKEKRTVSGFATLDNLDRHGDIVTAEASKKAFDNFRGNIREMHGASAVGKMVNFKEDNFFDPETQKKYNGIYVTAYISKGAQDAWEKCLDGTYSGFSIGGNIIDAKMEKSDDGSESHRVIHNFDLHELSLVDSPANQLANIFSIQKMAEGIVTENVFWCSKDEVASTSTATSKSCVVCEADMTNIGWVEQADTEKFEAIEKVIDSYFKKDDAPTSAHEATESAAPGLAGNQTGNVNVVDTTVATLMYPDQNEKNKVTKSDEFSLGEGGNTMAEDTDATIEKSIDAKAPAEEVAVVEEVAVAADDSVEKAVSISEVEDSLDFEKVVSDLKTFLGESLNKSYSDSSAAVEAMNKVFEETSASLAKQIAELGEKYEALNKSVTDMYGKIEYVNHQLSNFESASAVKKSSDLNGSLESKKINKSIWQGAFLKGNSLNNL
jgi:Putative phage serine protease XkdF